MNDVLGQAIWDFYHNKRKDKLWIHNRYGRREEMPVHVYFRQMDEMPEMELLSLQQCAGTILDIGAGAGAHSMLLQQMGKDVTAIDISAKAIEIAQMRGMQKAIACDIFDFTPKPFDTLLLLMNGIGLTANISGLRRFLHLAKKLLKKKGQLLFDSSDVAYLYKKRPKPDNRYYGEIEYCYQYKNVQTDWFYWLYIDLATLTKIAAEEGWRTELLMQDDFDQYLVRLTPIR